MASTKRIPTQVPEKNKQRTQDQIQKLLTELRAKLSQYEKENDQSYPIEIKEKEAYDYVNPNHYKQEDGRQTWELMVDEFGLEETAIFCKLNAYKYRDRIGKKPGENEAREEKKAIWYEEKAEELEELHKKQNKSRGLFGNL